MVIVANLERLMVTLYAVVYTGQHTLRDATDIDISLVLSHVILVVPTRFAKINVSPQIYNFCLQRNLL